MISLYKCPVCNIRLTEAKVEFFCPNNHHFDIAKEHYVNLLLPNQKASKEPGDNKEMLIARRAFLETGHYNPLIAEIIAGAQQIINPKTILDIGCGEGTYTNAFALAFKSGILYAMDIAKPAIQMAAKKYNAINFCVASAARLPYLDKGFDLVISIFAPYEIAEIKRILNPGGVFILVGPGPQHLQELAAIVYAKVAPHKMDLPNLEAFKLVSQTELNYSINLAANEIINLWKMSPYYWHTKADTTSEIATLKKVTADFKINAYQI